MNFHYYIGMYSIMPGYKYLPAVYAYWCRTSTVRFVDLPVKDLKIFTIGLSGPVLTRKN